MTRARVNENLKVFHGHSPIQLEAGQVVKGSLAELLLRTAPTKVTAVDERPAKDPVPVPAELDINGTAPEVLAWVGTDAERAREALAAEQAKGDAARSTLVKALEKVTAT